MQIRAESKGLSLKVQFVGTLPEHIVSDPTRLRQILINLIGNAIKFTEIGEVRLVVRSGTGHLQIEVIDSGIGIDPAQIDNLFEHFGQGDASTTRRFGGTGLGLTISQRLAVMLGGDITAQSEIGNGSTFTVRIVARVPEMDQEVTLAHEVAGTESHSETIIQLNCRVLLAEDGPDNQRLISFFLEKAGAEVTVCENGQLAVELALTAWRSGHPFDVVVMDMQMPVLDGYSATTELRAEGYSGAIVALTANAMSSDREKCLAAGCDDYTTKPIDRCKFLALVQQWASEPSHNLAT